MKKPKIDPNNWPNLIIATGPPFEVKVSSFTRWEHFKNLFLSESEIAEREFKKSIARGYPWARTSKVFIPAKVILPNGRRFTIIRDGIGPTAQFLAFRLD